MYAIYGNIYHQYTPNVSIYTIHGSYGLQFLDACQDWSWSRKCSESFHAAMRSFLPDEPEKADALRQDAWSLYHGIWREDMIWHDLGLWFV